MGGVELLAADRRLVEELRAELRRVADPARSGPMQAYMKSQMPFLGVPAPELRRVCKETLRRRPPTSTAAWEATVAALWDEATHREERYAALTLLAAYPRNLTTGVLPLLERLVVEGAWWDLVDGLARRVGDVLRRDPNVRETMVAWSRDGDLWKRRVSIICQLGFKERTDLGLLYATIEANLADRDFFIRKAIGWALRDYARTDPDEVRRYLGQQGDRLSPLSRREAAKHLD